MTTREKIFGTVRRWRIGDVYYAKNNLVTMAYMINSDHASAGAIGTSGPGDDAVFVQYITTDQSKLWDGAPDKEPT